MRTINRVKLDVMSVYTSYWETAHEFEEGSDKDGAGDNTSGSLFTALPTTQLVD